jgi:integrase
MTISFYLKRPKSDVDTSIYAILFYEGYRLKYYTPERIHPKNWNSEAQKARQTDKFKEYPEFNRRLTNWRTDVANIYRTWVNDHGGTIPAPDTLKEVLNEQLDKKAPKKETVPTFFDYYEQFLAKSKQGSRINVKSKKSVTNSTTKGYKSTLNHLKNFQKVYNRPIDFPTIDLDFHGDYLAYLNNTAKLGTNTIGDHIKRIKTVMNEATERGINKNLTFRSKYFVKPSEETKSIYLTETELQELEALDLSGNKRLDNVRDLFLVGCYTGLRYSDYSILKPEQIQDGFIETTQKKTGDPVVIPVHPTVERILAKYGGRLPRSISNQKTNDYLKELGATVPEGREEPVLNETISKTVTKGGKEVTHTYKKWELLTTHTARRSFATNEYKAGTPAITIMAITGHKTEKAFMRYIKLTPKEHAKILQLQWQERRKSHELKAVS